MRPWDGHEWWQRRCGEYEAMACQRHAEHGLAVVQYYMLAIGKTLAYHCQICGWERAVLVQEGTLPPEAPGVPREEANCTISAEARRKRARKAILTRWSKDKGNGALAEARRVLDAGLDAQPAE